MKPRFGQNVLHDLLGCSRDFHFLMEQSLFEELYIKKFTVIIDDLKDFLCHDILLKACTVFMGPLTDVVVKTVSSLMAY